MNNTETENQTENKRGRKPGQKNRPRARLIALSELNKMFKPDTKIPVDFSLLFNSSLESAVPSAETQVEEQNIQLTIHNQENI